MLNAKEIERKLTRKERRNLLKAWDKVLATNPTFDKCLNEIDSDCRALLAMDLNESAKELINNIGGNVITMSVIHYSCINDNDMGVA